MFFDGSVFFGEEFDSPEPLLVEGLSLEELPFEEDKVVELPLRESFT